MVEFTPFLPDGTVPLDGARSHCPSLELIDVLFPRYPSAKAGILNDYLRYGFQLVEGMKVFHSLNYPEAGYVQELAAGSIPYRHPCMHTWINAYEYHIRKADLIPSAVGPAACCWSRASGYCLLLFPSYSA